MKSAQKEWPPKTQEWQALESLFERLRLWVSKVEVMELKISSDDLQASINRLPKPLKENLLSDKYSASVIPENEVFVSFFAELEKHNKRLEIKVSGSRPELCQKVLRKALGALYQQYGPLINIYPDNSIM